MVVTPKTYCFPPQMTNQYFPITYSPFLDQSDPMYHVIHDYFEPVTVQHGCVVFLLNSLWSRDVVCGPIDMKLVSARVSELLGGRAFISNKDTLHLSRFLENYFSWYTWHACGLAKPTQ